MRLQYDAYRRERLALRVSDDAHEDDLLPAPRQVMLANPPIQIRFDWAAPATRVAAFRRGRDLWVVFDRRAPDGIAGRIAKSVPEVAPVVRFSAENDPEATVLRMVLPASMAPTLFSMIVPSELINTVVGMDVTPYLRGTLPSSVQPAG